MLVVCLLAQYASYAQGASCLPNEEIIFSFGTKNGRKAVLVRDKANGYLLYRFGTAQKTELEFPGRKPDSWKAFTHSAYERGGGIQNEGMSLDYVFFTNNGYRYVLYQTYYARGNQQRVGVKITNLATNKTTDIPGVLHTMRGSLGFFRGQGLIAEGEELFE